MRSHYQRHWGSFFFSNEDHINLDNKLKCIQYLYVFHSSLIKLPGEYFSRWRNFCLHGINNQDLYRAVCMSIGKNNLQKNCLSTNCQSVQCLSAKQQILCKNQDRWFIIKIAFITLNTYIKTTFYYHIQIFRKILLHLRNKKKNKQFLDHIIFKYFEYF